MFINSGRISEARFPMNPLPIPMHIDHMADAVIQQGQVRVNMYRRTVLGRPDLLFDLFDRCEVSLELISICGSPSRPTL